MQLPEIETGSSGLYQAVDEYTVSSHVLPLTGTALSCFGVYEARNGHGIRVHNVESMLGDWP